MSTQTTRKFNGLQFLYVPPNKGKKITPNERTVLIHFEKAEDLEANQAELRTRGFQQRRVEGLH